MMLGRARHAGLAVLLMGAAAFGAAPGGGAPGGAAYLAGELVNDARDILRDVTIDPANAAKQATVLLQFAARLDPSDLHTQRLLAHTAAAAGETDVQKEALRKVIAGDPGDLVSQVRYIDVLAAASQALDDQAKTYQGALDQVGLDAQIRSEMALRLGAIAESRQDVAGARQFFTRALQLNDLNVPALRGMVRVAVLEGNLPANQVVQMKALASLLITNPLEPDAWAEAGRLCARAGLHDRAAEFFSTVADQEQISGAWPDLPIVEQVALEGAIAGQYAHALSAAQAISSVPDAPLESLLVLQLLVDESGAASQPAGTATRNDGSQNLAEIGKRLKAMVADAKGDNRAAALADAAGIELTVFPGNVPDAGGWIDAYGKLVAEDDPTLARLRGWQLYREGKVDDAATALGKVAATDPLAQLGLAKINLELKNRDKAQDLLQDLWGTHPSGLLALQVARTARVAKINLTDGTWAQQMRAAAAGLTPAVMSMHRNMGDMVLMTTNYRKDTVNYGEPVLLAVRMSNTTSHALPVGDDGVVKTSLGLGAVGPSPEVTLGLYAVEDVQRVYRIAPHQFVEATIRADQGELGDVLRQSPGKKTPATLWAVSSPRMLGSGGGKEFATGIGGEGVATGDFTVNGFTLATAGNIDKLIADLNAASGEQKLIRIDAAGALLKEMGTAGSAAAGLPALSKEALKAAYGALARSDDPLVRAEYLRALPVDKVDNRANHAADGLAVDADPLVRVMCLRYGAAVVRGLPDEEGMKMAMEKSLARESDTLVKAWQEAAIAQANADAAAKSATATRPSDGH